MTDIRPYIKQIINSGGTVNVNSLNEKALELLIAGKKEEASLIAKLAKDSFTKADSDKSGDLNLDEVEMLSTSGTPDLNDLLPGEPPPQTRTSTGSTRSTPPAPTYTPNPYTGPKATDIESYFKTIDQANYKGGDVIKHVNLPTIALKDTNTVASSCLERGGKTLRILIHPKNFNEGCSIQEYKIDFSQIMALLEKKGITTSFVKEFPTLNSTIKLHEDNPESIRKLAEAVFGTLLQGDPSNIKTLFPSAEFRQGVGVKGLQQANFGTIPEPQPPLEVSDIVSDGIAQTYISSQSPTQQSTQWAAMKVLDGKASTKLYKVNGEYRLLFIQARGDQRHVVEYSIPENELVKLANMKLANVNFNNIDSVRDWIISNVKLNKDPITAFIEKEQGFPQLGEISGLKVKRSGWRESAQAAFSQLKEGDLTLSSGIIPNPTPVDIPAGLTNNRFNSLHAITDLPAFNRGDGWKIKVVFQDQYTTIFWWNEATSPATYEEYVIPTANINNYLKDRTGKDFSGLLSTNYKAGTRESEDLKKLFISLFAQTLKTDGYQKVQGTEYYKRSAPTIAGLTNMDFDKGPQKTTSSGMDGVRKNP